jgi:hypothetical protein
MVQMYARRIKIERPDLTTGEGAIGYGGLTRAKLSTIFTDIHASVQARNSGKANTVHLPADTPVAEWRVMVKRGQLADGDVRNKDVITDDLGRRFEVKSDYCHGMGMTLTVDRLEA